MRSGTRTCPPSPRSPWRAGPPPSSASGSPREIGGLRDDLVEAVRKAVPDADPRRRPVKGGPPPGQRPLQLPRLRGRLAAPAARRPGHRVLHGLRVHGGRGPAQPRPAGHRHRSGPGRAPFASPSGTPRRRRTSTRSRGRSDRRWNGLGRQGSASRSAGRAVRGCRGDRSPPRYALPVGGADAVFAACSAALRTSGM